MVNNVGKLLVVPRDTVKAWCRTPGTDGYRVIPSEQLAKLLLVLGNRETEHVSLFVAESTSQAIALVEEHHGGTDKQVIVIDDSGATAKAFLASSLPRVVVHHGIGQDASAWADAVVSEVSFEALEQTFSTLGRRALLVIGNVQEHLRTRPEWVKKLMSLGRCMGVRE